MMVSDFVEYLKEQFPDVKFYNGTINKSDTECIGVYLKGGPAPTIALGGVKNTSYGTIPVSILVHWSESSSKCERKALDVYNHLFGLSNVEMNGKNVRTVQLIDPHPVDIARDSNNICEMVIRANIIYSKEVQESED